MEVYFYYYDIKTNGYILAREGLALFIRRTGAHKPLGLPACSACLSLVVEPTPVGSHPRFIYSTKKGTIKVPFLLVAREGFEPTTQGL